eukprot:1151102-Rhodomonas_salina.3
MAGAARGGGGSGAGRVHGVAVRGAWGRPFRAKRHSGRRVAAVEGAGGGGGGGDGRRGAGGVHRAERERPSTLDPRPSTLDPKPQTLDPRPYALQDPTELSGGGGSRRGGERGVQAAADARVDRPPQTGCLGPSKDARFASTLLDPRP